MFQADFLEGTLYRKPQFLDFKRLGDVIISAGFHRFHGHFGGSVGGDHNDQRFLGIVRQAFQQGDSVFAGHIDIGEHEVRLVHFDSGSSSLCAGGFENLRLPGFQRPTNAISSRFFIIDD